MTVSSYQAVKMLQLWSVLTQRRHRQLGRQRNHRVILRLNIGDTVAPWDKVTRTITAILNIECSETT